MHVIFKQIIRILFQSFTEEQGLRIIKGRKGAKVMRNEMMHRPVVKPELVEYMRTKQKKLPGELGEVEAEANEAGCRLFHRNSSFSTIFARTTKAQIF